MQRVALQAKFSIEGKCTGLEKNLPLLALAVSLAVFQPSGTLFVPSSVESVARACGGHMSNGIKGHCFYFVLHPESKVSISTQLRSNAFWFYWSGLFWFSPALSGSAFRLQAQSSQRDGSQWIPPHSPHLPMSSVLKIAKWCCCPATALQCHHTWLLSFLLGEEPLEGC